MFVHELGGSWINHPFWRKRFMVDDAAMVERVRSSGVPDVVIDTARGADIDDTAPAAAPAPEAAPPAPPPPPALEVGPDYRDAAALCQASLATVRTLFDEARMGRPLDREACTPVVEQVFDSVAANPAALTSVARLKTADSYTYQHAVALCALMVRLARQIDLPPDQVRAAGLAGLMADCGKALLPPELLNRNGRVNEAERLQLQAHVRHGHELLRAAGFGEDVADAALHHHERFDGSGYPDRLPGAKTGLFARMTAICDVYDAVTSRRPYRAPWDPGEAMRHMAQSKGQFDATLFQHFVKALGIYPVGSLVRLQSERLAVVLEQNPASLLTPRVKVFYSIEDRHAVDAFVLDLADAKSGDRIVGVESPDAWRFPGLDKLWLQHR